jgi:hypothetical protein
MHANLLSSETQDRIEKQRTFIDIEFEDHQSNGSCSGKQRQPRSQKRATAAPSVSPVDTLAVAEVLRSEIARLEERLSTMESLLREVHERMVVGSVVKEYYTTQEVARRLNKRPYTVREWCRLGRVHGEKSHSGRGLDDEWRISHAELVRIENEGLLPIAKGTAIKGPSRLA